MALLNDSNFERDIKAGVSVVKFYSLWNMDSRAFESSFRELSIEYLGKAKFMLSEINSNAVLAKKEGITKIPAVAIYINGSQVSKITGLTKRAVREQIEYFLKKAESL